MSEFGTFNHFPKYWVGTCPAQQCPTAHPALSGPLHLSISHLILLSKGEAEGYSRIDTCAAVFHKTLTFRSEQNLGFRGDKTLKYLYSSRYCAIELKRKWRQSLQKKISENKSKLLLLLILRLWNLFKIQMNILDFQIVRTLNGLF